MPDSRTAEYPLGQAARADRGGRARGRLPACRPCALIARAPLAGRRGHDAPRGVRAGELGGQPALAHRPGSGRPMPSTSGSSEEIIRIGDALPGELARAARAPRPWCPTSMPRVGSSTMSSAGRPSHLARTTFCWLPPDSMDDRVGEPAVLQPQPLGPIAGERAARRPPRIRPPFRSPPSEASATLRRDRHVHDQALLAPVLRHEADPGRIAAVGAPGAARWPRHGHRSGVVAVDPEDRRAPPRCGPGPPGPPARRSPPRAPRSEMSVNTPSRVSRSPVSTGSPGWRRSPAVRSGMSRPDHRAHEVVGGHAGQPAGQHAAAVAHHGHRAGRSRRPPRAGAR